MNLFIASISALATIAAAIIYYYTLNEIKKQRENTYKPHLFIDNIYFYVQSMKKGELMFPSIWSNESKDVTKIFEFSNKHLGLSDFGLKCFNIGFGTAKNVNISFAYDIDIFIDQINQLNKYVSPELLIIVKKEFGLISLKCENKDIPYPNKIISIDNCLSSYLSYILPVNVKNEHSTVKLPLHFLELLNVYVFLFSSISEKEENNFELNIPLITAEIKYQDISNRQFSIKMKIVTKFTMLSTSGYVGEFKINEYNSDEIKPQMDNSSFIEDFFN